MTISNIAGEFANGQVVIGASSNAQFMIGEYNPLKDNVRDDSYDNFVIQNQANNIIDLTEINPFGQI